MAYRFKLLSQGIKAPSVFHVSKVKRTLHPLENVGCPNVLVELIDPPSTPNRLERILGFRDRSTRHSVHKEALVKQKDSGDKASMWEQINMLRQNYPHFVFVDKNSS